jgi:cation transport ATPase
MAQEASESSGESQFSDIGLQEFAESQKKQAEVREKELALQREKLNKEERQGERALEAQLEDRKRQRDHQDRIHRRNQRYGIAIILFVLAFLGFLVFYNQPEMAFEIIKLVVYGASGYYAGKKAGKYEALSRDPNGDD